MAKQDDYTKTALRLPRELHQKLTDAAAERGHSLNTEMVYRLDGSFGGPMPDSDQQLEIAATLEGFRGVIKDVVTRENERDEAVRAMGGDLHRLCREALPFLGDETVFGEMLNMLASVGVAMQAGDLTDAQGQLRGLYYLALKAVLLGDSPERHALIHGNAPRHKQARRKLDV